LCFYGKYPVNADAPVSKQSVPPLASAGIVGFFIHLSCAIMAARLFAAILFTTSGCVMPSNPSLPGSDLFGHLLERIGARRSRPVRVGGVRASLWLGRFNADPLVADVRTAYEADSDSASVARFAPASIRERFEAEFSAAAGLDEFRRLRRRYALLLQPDRAPANERAAAEALMAEINAAIDTAIRIRSPR